MTSPAFEWPELDWAAWRDTACHLQLMTQVVGKVRLRLAPWQNHGWQVALYVTPRGLTTSAMPTPPRAAMIGRAMPAGPGSVAVDFDFADAVVRLAASDGATRTVPLAAGTVADFYTRVMAALADLGVVVAIDDRPNEMADPVRFRDDHAVRPFDLAAVRDFHAALVAVDIIFKDFRTSFLGKASPVHFFWGSFDLAVSRFSGRRAPAHPGGSGLPLAVAQEAYSHEVSSAGFWPGSEAFPRAAFYSYAYPAPPGFADARIAPAAARFDAGLGEFVLAYDDVRATSDPAAAVLAFLESTYAAAADLGGWDRAALDCARGVAGVPRAIG